MAGYAKLWSSIVDSSLWSGSKDAKILFVTLMAKADQTGFVEAAPSGLARAANLTLAETKAALAELSAPDPESKSKAAEGRRITIVPRGYCLVNYEEHRDRESEQDRREYMREYMREYRAKGSVNIVTTDGGKQDVNNGKQKLALLGQAASASLFSLAVQSVDSSGSRSSDACAYVNAPELGEADSEKQGRIVDSHLAAALEVLDGLNAARKRLRPSSRGIRPSYTSLGGIAARLAAGRTLEDCLHVIAVGEAECSRKPDSFDWFDTVTPWRPENFEKRAAMDPSAHGSRVMDAASAEKGRSLF